MIESHQTFDDMYCVDVFSRPNGTLGFEECRRDLEDMGPGRPIRYFSAHDDATQHEAFERLASELRGYAP